MSPGTLARYLILVTSCLLAAGAKSDDSFQGATPDALFESFNEARCCVYVEDLPATELPRRGRKEIDLADSGVLVDLSTGPSFGALLELPAERRQYDFYLRTDVIGHEGRQYAYFPYVAVFDTQRELLAAPGFWLIEYFSSTLFNPVAFLHLRIEIPDTDPTMPQARYVLIYTRPGHFTDVAAPELKGTPRSAPPRQSATIMNSMTGGGGIRGDSVYGLPAARISVGTNRFWP